MMNQNLLPAASTAERISAWPPCKYIKRDRQYKWGGIVWVTIGGFEVERMSFRIESYCKDELSKVELPPNESNRSAVLIGIYVFHQFLCSYITQSLVRETPETPEHIFRTRVERGKEDF